MLQQHPQIVTAVQALRCFHLFQVSRGTDVSLLLWRERLFLTVILLLVLFRGGWVVHLYTYLVKPSSQHCTYGSGHYRDPEPEFSSPTKRMTDISKQLGVTKNKGQTLSVKLTGAYLKKVRVYLNTSKPQPATAVKSLGPKSLVGLIA